MTARRKKVWSARDVTTGGRRKAASRSHPGVVFSGRVAYFDSRGNLVIEEVGTVVFLGSAVSAKVVIPPEVQRALGITRTKEVLP